MKPPSHTHIRDLIERVARIHAADEWTDDLNPTQRAALSYLARANRFSRTPSNVADFLSATRGTVSQTLKALARKGMIEEVRSQSDRRSISYVPTGKGTEALTRSTVIEEALSEMSVSTRQMLAQGLEELIRRSLRARGGKEFGMCRECRHHRKRKTGGFCALLDEQLEPIEAAQICHEYEEAT